MGAYFTHDFQEIPDVAEAFEATRWEDGFEGKTGYLTPVATPLNVGDAMDHALVLCEDRRFISEESPLIAIPVTRDGQVIIGWTFSGWVRAS